MITSSGRKKGRGTFFAQPLRSSARKTPKNYATLRFMLRHSKKLLLLKPGVMETLFLLARTAGKMRRLEYEYRAAGAAAKRANTDAATAAKTLKTLTRRLANITPNRSP